MHIYQRAHVLDLPSAAGVLLSILRSILSIMLFKPPIYTAIQSGAPAYGSPSRWAGNLFGYPWWIIVTPPDYPLGNYAPRPPLGPFNSPDQEVVRHPGRGANRPTGTRSSPHKPSHQLDSVLHFGDALPNSHLSRRDAGPPHGTDLGMGHFNPGSATSTCPPSVQAPTQQPQAAQPCCSSHFRDAS